MNDRDIVCWLTDAALELAEDLQKTRDLSLELRFQLKWRLLEMSRVAEGEGLDLNDFCRYLEEAEDLGIDLDEAAPGAYGLAHVEDRSAEAASCIPRPDSSAE